MTFHMLLTTDLSDESARCFAQAATLVQRMGGKITLLHALLEPTVMSSGFPSLPGHTAQNREEYLAEAGQAMARLRAQLPVELEVDLEIAEGMTVAAILDDYATAHGVDVIAMATHGRSGVRRVLMGSVAEALLRRTHTPILLFPPPSEAKQSG